MQIEIMPVAARSVCVARHSFCSAVKAGSFRADRVDETAADEETRGVEVALIDVGIIHAVGSRGSAAKRCMRSTTARALVPSSGTVAGTRKRRLTDRNMDLRHVRRLRTSATHCRLLVAAGSDSTGCSPARSDSACRDASRSRRSTFRVCSPAHTMRCTKPGASSLPSMFNSKPVHERVRDRCLEGVIAGDRIRGDLGVGRRDTFSDRCSLRCPRQRIARVMPNVLRFVRADGAATTSRNRAAVL